MTSTCLLHFGIIKHIKKGNITTSEIRFVNIWGLWERAGRLMAQEAFNVAMSKIEAFVFKTPEERYLDLVEQQPDIFNSIPLYHISSYLGIKGPSLSRIRKRISAR